MNLVLFILSLVLLWHNTTTATSLGVMNKKCIDKERQALLDFKALILQDPKGQLSTWRVDEELDDCCKWSGVSCNSQTGHVTELYLGDGDIKGEISSSLLNLTYLTRLDLPGTYYTGTITYLQLGWNDFNGTIPAEFGNNKSLQELSVVNHTIYTLEYIDWLYNDSMPGFSLAQAWENASLSIQKLSSLSVADCEFKDASLNSSSSIVSIYIGNNSLEGAPPKAHMSMFYDRMGFDFSSCKLGPGFPLWIQTFNDILSLSIANNTISDTIPIDFWNTWDSRLSYLNVSLNNISGQVLDLSSNFGLYSSIDLSSNNFSGPILNVDSTVQALNLSKNKFSGGISFICQIVSGVLNFLDLSDNSFTGKIPNCLSHFKELEVLNLGNNNLSGRIPASVESLIGLKVLYLYNNGFYGELPLSLKNCTKLTFLYLGANQFYGNVPVWIGENLSGLTVLSLTSNNFSGTIPLQLCQLVNLQILDLSMNNLNGTIPSCLNNLTTMVQKGFSQNQSLHFHSWTTRTIGEVMISHPFEFVDYAMIKWQGIVREFSSTLGFVKIIDLSSNNLNGEIPRELTNLYGLIVLDLSHNALNGEIPQHIGAMKDLLTLNLSRNNFSGRIPSSMSQMASLSRVDFSYNNLSGRVPTGTQLQTFEPSWFTGNPGLCGLPATRHCPGDEDLQVPPTVGESEGGGEVGDELERWFYIGGASGFGTGFWIVCSALLLNRRGRHAFFNFLDNLRDWVYVKVMVFNSKLPRPW